MKKEIFSIAWSNIRPYMGYIIGFIIGVAIYISFPVKIDPDSVVDVRYAEKLMSLVNDYKSDNMLLLDQNEKLLIKLVEANVVKDSLATLVDSFEPEIINTIEYITDGTNNVVQIDSAKQQLVAGIGLMSIERKELINGINIRDKIIETQGKQIDNLNIQIELFVESNHNLVVANGKLSKQIRKEVRKRRLTLVASAAAIVGVIWITSQ